MRGVVFLGERRLEVQEFPDPTPGPGEVVIEVKASGMCGTDLKFYRPSRAEATRALGLGGDGEPNIAGHEPCGFVAERGIDVDHLFTQRYTNLDEAEEAYRLLDTQTTGKGVFLL